MSSLGGSNLSGQEGGVLRAIHPVIMMPSASPSRPEKVLVDGTKSFSRQNCGVHPVGIVALPVIMLK